MKPAVPAMKGKRKPVVPQPAPSSGAKRLSEAPPLAAALAEIGQALKQLRASGRLKDLAKVLNSARKHRLRLKNKGHFDLEPDRGDEDLMNWWNSWFIGSPTDHQAGRGLPRRNPRPRWFVGDQKRFQYGKVWYVLADHPEAIEHFLAFGSFLDVDGDLAYDDLAYGAWPQAQQEEAAAIRVLDELRLSLVESGTRASGKHTELEAMSILTVTRHADEPQSQHHAEANGYLKRLREFVRTRPTEEIRRARRRFEDFLNARKEAMELLKRGPYQMPREGLPVSSFKLFARRLAMGLLDKDFFEGIPFSSFLRLPRKERHEVLRCFEAPASGRRRGYQPIRGKTQHDYKRLMAWLLDNWPVFFGHRWDWNNVFDASLEAGFAYHKSHISLIKWFSNACPDHRLNPDHKVGHAKQESLFASTRHLLTQAPPSPASR